jgi:lipase
MTVMLNVHLYGPWHRDDSPTVLAVHGVTGHGARWRPFVEQQLPDARVLAPDLRGHGRSPWTPPWHLEQHVADLVEVITHHGAGPVTVIGHSLGGALACRLALSHPELVRSLLLLDPAQQLDPEMCETIAEQSIEYFDFASPEEARADKVNGAWTRVPAQLLDTEIAEHLHRTDSGRWAWQVSRAAAATLWGELAREAVAPPGTIPTTVLRAARAHFVTDAFLSALAPSAEVVTVDSDHMVAQEIPEVIGEYARRSVSTR